MTPVHGHVHVGQLPTAPPAFFAVEGAAPEDTRCEGMLEMLLLRDPVERLESFGRELNRWGLLKLQVSCR